MGYIRRRTSRYVAMLLHLPPFLFFFPPKSRAKRDRVIVGTQQRGGVGRDDGLPEISASSLDGADSLSLSPPLQSSITTVAMKVSEGHFSLLTCMYVDEGSTNSYR
jgi:hypothetical protein